MVTVRKATPAEKAEAAKRTPTPEAAAASKKAVEDRENEQAKKLFKGKKPFLIPDEQY